jgi:hypothetical protein
MGFMVDNIPYGLNIGLDLGEYTLDQKQLTDCIFKLEENKLDYLIYPVSIEGSGSLEERPIYVDDFMLFGHEWKGKYATKLRSGDLKSGNFEKLVQDLEYAYYLNTKSIVLDMRSELIGSEMYQVSRVFRKFFQSYPDRIINVIFDFDQSGLEKWKKLTSMLGYIDNVAVVLRINPDLPEEGLLYEWAAHNVKSIQLPLSSFVTNKNGFPVLSSLHQVYLKHLFSYHVDVIIEDDEKALFDSEKNTIDVGKIKDYFIYICHHMFSKHREFVGYDYLLHSYLDVFQIPLQPLRDNLQSQTYECFEEDQTKYDQYELAVYKALMNYKETGYLRKNITTESSDGITNRKLVACVLGGGRGPLVRRVHNASKKSGVELTIICVEKNRYAFNTILSLKQREPEVFGSVITVLSDMRDYKPETKLDIVVSELLGSFGDNELSPECLYNIQQYLSEDSIMVPHSYTSYIRPISCPVVWNNVNSY